MSELGDELLGRDVSRPRAAHSHANESEAAALDGAHPVVHGVGAGAVEGCGVRVYTRMRAWTSWLMHARSHGLRTAQHGPVH